MDNKLREKMTEKLENGEKLIWAGRAKEGKVMSSIYAPAYIRNIILSYGITGFAAVKCVLTNLKAGDPVDLVPVVLLLVMGSILPLSSLADAVKAQRLQYAATDRRLISLNGDNMNSVPYSSIHEAVLKQDSDGNTSLLCGKTGVKLKEGRWRDIATLNCTTVSGNRECDRFVLYAVDDVDGLKAAVSGQLNI